MSSPSGSSADALPRRRGSLALRLTLWYALTSFALIVAAVGVLYWALLLSLSRQHESYFRDKVFVLHQLLARQPRALSDLQEEVEETWAPRQYARVFGRILDAQGHVIVESPNMVELLNSRAFGQPAPEGHTPAAIPWTSPEDHAYELSAVSLQVGTPPQLYTIQLALDEEPERQLLRRYQLRLGLVLAVALIACATVGYQIARRGLQPLGRISAVVQQIRPSTLDRRIDAGDLAAEFRGIADTLNAMLNTMEDAFARLSRFSADLAHELRTPLGNLRGQVEVALSQKRSDEDYREVLASCLEETVRLSQIIDSLLFLARAEDPRTQIRSERVDLTLELIRVCEFYDAAATEAGVALRVGPNNGVSATVDRTLLQRAVSNLVANALAHTPRGGNVTVSAYRENAQVCVAVQDTGHGIPQRDVPRVFDRFYRVDPSRSGGPGSGVGLGLPIVKGIMTMHGGTVDIASTLGQGTKVRLLFP